METIGFPEQPPARVFRTSGTTDRHGTAKYTRLGLDLMNSSILAHARATAFAGLDRPAVVRLVPEPGDAPDMVMAHGMALIAERLGHGGLSPSVVGPRGIDVSALCSAVEAAIAECRPVVLIGASFAFVTLCDVLEAQGKCWALPGGSRVIDAGGFKGRSRSVAVPELHVLLMRAFGVPSDRCINLFGMTELASQLYDADTEPVGPRGERAKRGTSFVEPRLRDAHTMRTRSDGFGLLEVADFCVLDRPYVVLSGDVGIARAGCVAVVGRVAMCVRIAERRADPITCVGPLHGG